MEIIKNKRKVDSDKSTNLFIKRANEYATHSLCAFEPAFDTLALGILIPKKNKIATQQMTQKVTSKEKFAKFYFRLWSDPKVLELDPFEERFFITSFTNLYSIKVITGIYEIGRSQYIGALGFNNERLKMLSKYGISIPKKIEAYDVINDIIKSFNENHNSILEYDTPNHMIFIKNYFKYQNRTIGNVSVAIRMILNEFSDYFLKAEKFWFQFGKKYKNELEELKSKLDEYIKHNDSLLFDLNVELKNKIERQEKVSNELLKKINNTKELLSEYKKLKPRYEDFLQKLSLS